jgi:uncharacterized protein
MIATPSKRRRVQERSAKRRKTLPKCRLVLVKVASTCNLNCSYCYVYNLGDTSYLAQPPVMSRTTAEALVARVAAHCTRHRLREFTFAFHGGEPLLARPDFYRHFVACVRATLPPYTKVTYFMQTNGMLLTPQWCALLRELNIIVGISVDGPADVNDRHRVDHAGRGSYQRVRRGWDTAVAGGLQPGLLAVVDVAADPSAVYDHLKLLKPRSVDFLLPEATHDRLPPGLPADDDEATPYADWLLAIFHRWINDEAAQFPIRLFEHIIQNVLGIRRKTDALGRGRNEVLVVESNGGIESVDVLKVCEDGIAKTPFNVHCASLDDALSAPVIQLYYFSNERLCAICRRCPVRDLCAGGYLPHRYSAQNGFDNPSVYCRDLMKLIIAIQNWVYLSIPVEVSEQQQFAALSYAQARTMVRRHTEHAAVRL